jgi:hypothetical protein
MINTTNLSVKARQLQLLRNDSTSLSRPPAESAQDEDGSIDWIGVLTGCRPSDFDTYAEEELRDFVRKAREMGDPAIEAELIRLGLANVGRE